MTNYADFNLEYKPTDFFESIGFEEKAGGRIVGEARRVAALEKVKTRYYPPELVGRKFHSYLREKEGKRHPWLMGGEYLPHLENDEIEICRIVLRSSTLDIISIRAKLQEKHFEYNVVDEHNVCEYKPPQFDEKNPITMRQLIEIIENCDRDFGDPETNLLEGEKGLILPIIKQQFSANMRGEEVNDFLSVHSVFYPQIEEYFNIRIREIWRDLFDKND